MLEKAIEKINAEIEKNKGNFYIQAIGEFLVSHVSLNPATAENILKEGKTIGGSLKASRDVAIRKRSLFQVVFNANDCVPLSSQEVFETVLKYFDIEGLAVSTDVPIPTEVAQAPVDPVLQEVKPKSGFDYKADDFF